VPQRRLTRASRPGPSPHESPGPVSVPAGPRRTVNCKCSHRSTSGTSAQPQTSPPIPPQRRASAPRRHWEGA
jgi:hypothetical protein